jgi:hypothetical protein
MVASSPTGTAALWAYLLRLLQNALQPVQEHVHELVRVLLLAHIHGLSRTKKILLANK